MFKGFLDISKPRSRRRSAKASAILIAGFLGIGLVTNSVMAALDATSANSSPQSITSGTLKITQVDVGSGFTAAIAAIAPGDTFNRFITYTNTGTLGGATLKLQATATISTLLNSDATKGLQVLVTRCSGVSAAWTVSSGVATCNGTLTVVLNTISVANLISAGTSGTAFLTGFSSLAPGETASLRFSLSLPATTETTVNGIPPENTIQGLISTILFTVNAVQGTPNTGSNA